MIKKVWVCDDCGADGKFKDKRSLPKKCPQCKGNRIVPRQPRKFYIGDWVIYRGNTYSFPGQICAVTDDGQFVVRAIGTPEGYYKGMKHLYGQKQLKIWRPK